MSNRHEITSAQLMTFIISSEVGVGILTLPSLLAKDVNHDGWISVVLSGLIVIIVIILINLFLKKYPSKSIFEINKYLYGKYIGAFLNYVLTAYAYFMTSAVLRIFNDTIKLTVLKLTPSIILSLFVLVPTIYLTWYGLNVICKFESILYIIMIIVIIFFLFIIKNIRITFLQPAGEAGLMRIIKGISSSVFSYLGFELITFIYPNVKDKENALKRSIGAVFIVMVFYTIVVIVTTGCFGEVRLLYMELPFFSLSRIYRSVTIERADLFFISIWFPVMANAMGAYYFCAYYSVTEIFNIKRNKLFLSLFTLGSVLLSRIPKNSLDVSNYMNKLSILGTIVIGFIIVSYLFSFFNKRGAKQE